MREWVQRHPGWTVFAVLVGLFALYEIFASFVAYTADAFVLSDIIVVAPEVAGPITTVAVARNQAVKAGDLLFEIDPTPFALKVQQYKAAVELAKANHQKATTEVAAARDAITEAEATLGDAELTYQRLAAILASGAVTVQRVDDARRDLDTAKARVAELKADQETASQDVLVEIANIAVAEADLAEAEYGLSRTRITAAADGVVAPYQVKAGDYATVGSAVMAIVASRGWRVIANLPDYYLGVIRPGQRAWVHISTDPWRFHEATILSVPRGIARDPTELGVLPYVAPTTEWIRLPRRFPVEVRISDLADSVPLFSGSDARVLTFANTFARPAAPTLADAPP